MISLKNFFHHKPTSTPNDGLTQGQREAIVDLLNYCSYADRNISQSEEEMIDGLETKLGWDPNQDFDYYVGKSVAVVRGVIEDKDAAPDFLQGVRKRLDSVKSRDIALNLCDKLFKSTGKVTPADSEALKAIAAALE